MKILVLAVKLLLLHVVLGDSNACTTNLCHRPVPHSCTTSPDINLTVCRQKECVLMAEELLEKMNSSMDPCHNFYEYACGGWINRQFLNPERQRVTTFERKLPYALIRKFLAEEISTRDHPSVRKAKDAYQLCMQFTNSTPSYTAVISVIDNRFSEWPLLYQERYFNRPVIFDLQSSLKEAFFLGVYPLFTLQADPSSFTDAMARNQRSKLYIGKPVLGMPIDHYVEFSYAAAYQDIYAKKILKDAENFRSFDRIWALQEAKDIVMVEERLSEMYNNLPTKGITVNMTLQELTTQYGQLLNWTDFVSDLASSPEIGITDITPEEVVVVSDPEYLRLLDDYFPRLSKRSQANYLYWRVIDSLQNVLIEDQRKPKYFLTDTARGSRPYPYTELDCVKYVSEVFDLVVHRLLYQAVKPFTITMMPNLIGRLTNRFRQLINGSESRLRWADEHMQRVLRDKLTDLPFLNFYEQAMNDSLLDSYYSNITFGASGFINFVIEARKVAFVRDFKNIRRIGEADPGAVPQQSLAELSARYNKHYLSPLILHQPFYNDVSYMTHVFAGFGSIVAHSIMYWYDATRFHYNLNGHISDYWDDNSSQRFLNSTRCMVNEYNNFFYRTAQQYLNGALTLDSNMADATGLKVAYTTYKAYNPSLDDRTEAIRLPGVTLSDEQVFFLLFAQLRCTKETYLSARSRLSSKHSPDEFRVNGPLRNLPGFATAFNCSFGSFMNPLKKCVVY